VTEADATRIMLAANGFTRLASSVDMDELASIVALVRAQALEDAAAKCGRTFPENGVARECAAAIRGMK